MVLNSNLQLRPWKISFRPFPFCDCSAPDNFNDSQVPEDTIDLAKPLFFCQTHISRFFQGFISASPEHDISYFEKGLFELTDRLDASPDLCVNFNWEGRRADRKRLTSFLCNIRALLSSRL